MRRFSVTYFVHGHRNPKPFKRRFYKILGYNRLLKLLMYNHGLLRKMPRLRPLYYWMSIGSTIAIGFLNYFTENRLQPLNSLASVYSVGRHMKALLNQTIFPCRLFQSCSSGTCPIWRNRWSYPNQLCPVVWMWDHNTWEMVEATKLFPKYFWFTIAKRNSNNNNNNKPPKIVVLVIPIQAYFCLLCVSLQSKTAVLDVYY